MIYTKVEKQRSVLSTRAIKCRRGNEADTVELDIMSFSQPTCRPCLQCCGSVEALLWQCYLLYILYEKHVLRTLIVSS
jgi:hypothetical protein